MLLASDRLARFDRTYRPRAIAASRLPSAEAAPDFARLSLSGQNDQHTQRNVNEIISLDLLE
jgi:hypothetical protein